MSVIARPSENGIQCVFDFGYIETGVTNHQLLLKKGDNKDFFSSFYSIEQLEQLKDAIGLYLDEIEELEES